MKRIRVLTALAGLLMLTSPGGLHGLINPKFTPVHLVQQSEVIVELKFEPRVRGGRATASVVSVLKGEMDAKTLTVDLTATAFPERARTVEKMIKEYAGRPVLMFIGELPDKPGEGTDAGTGAPGGAPRKAFLHMEGTWLVLFEGEDAWGFDEVSQPLVATWSGGTDMLLRAVKYILKDPDEADVPVRTGVTWAATVSCGRVAGKVSAVMPVDLAGDGTLALFVASDAGDRLFTFAGRTARDVTAERGVVSKSRIAAWGDLNGDGRADLVSWDGTGLTVFEQGADGKLSLWLLLVRPDCTSLAVAAAGEKGGTVVIIGTGSGPLRLASGKVAGPAPLVEGEWPGRNLGAAGPCVTADFDGDGFLDVLEVLSGGSLMYRGTAPGAFAAPAACEVSFGRGGRAVATGDWDADGLLDLLVTGDEGCRVWQNLGDGHFVESMRLSGELGYVAKEKAVAGDTCDLNNDGRQDLLVFYSGSTPQVFFNRGFRSFGFSLSMDLERGRLLSEATKGQQGGCAGDFTGDGAQDAAMVLADGTCAVLVRTPTGSDLCVRAVASAKSGAAGPVNVVATTAGRGLGAWNVTPGGAGAFVARPDAGPVVLRWRFPGHPPQTRKVLLVDKPVTVVLDPQEPPR